MLADPDVDNLDMLAGVVDSIDSELAGLDVVTTPGLDNPLLLDWALTGIRRNKAAAKAKENFMVGDTGCSLCRPKQN